MTHNKIPTYIIKIADKIAETLSPEKIILFGSYAYGDVTSDSDIDLLVILKTDLKSAERQRLISKIIYPRSAPMDIIVKTPEEIIKSKNRVDPFINEVLEKGKELYARS